jgi:hypothetical protein
MDGNPLPDSQDALVVHLTAKASVPHKIRNNLGAAAQFIENFKHRSTVTNSMTEAFSSEAQPTSLHTLLMSVAALPLVVHAWYDDLPQKALRPRSGWGSSQTPVPLIGGDCFISLSVPFGPRGIFSSPIQTSSRC